MLELGKSRLGDQTIIDSVDAVAASIDGLGTLARHGDRRRRGSGRGPLAVQGTSMSYWSGTDVAREKPKSG